MCSRDQSLYTVAVHEVHPKPAAVSEYDVPKTLTREQPPPQHPDHSLSSKQNLDNTYEIPPDSAGYAIPSSLPAEPEYTFMNPKNTLAKSKDDNGGYCEVGALDDKEDLGRLQQGKGDKLCEESSSDYALPEDPEYMFMNPLANNSKLNEKQCEKTSSAGYSIPLLPMEEEYTVMIGPQRSPAMDDDDDEDYCEVGALEEDKRDQQQPPEQ